MTFSEAMQVAAWFLLAASVVYAHVMHRKLRKTIFNDLKHRLLGREQAWQKAKKR